MSGGTGAGYRVETPAERRLREQRAALARYATAEAELAALRAEAQAYRSRYGKVVARVPAGGRLNRDPDPAAVDAATQAATELVRHHRAQLRAAVATAARQAVADLLATRPAAGRSRPGAARGPDHSAPPATVPAGAASPSLAGATPTGGGERPPAPPADAPQRRAELADRATELLARLPGSASEPVRRRCEQTAAEVARTGSPTRAQLLLSDLSEQVRTQTERAAAVERTQVQLARLVALLDTLPGPDADPLRDRIGQLVRDRAERLPDGLAAEVEARLAQVDAGRRRRVVADALRMSLDELGYDVGDGFETALATAGNAVAALPHAPGYGLKVLLDRDRAVLRTQVVRAASRGGGPEQDTGAERAFCRDYPTLLERLAAKGVSTERLGTYPPGTVPVQAVADALIPQRAGAAGADQRREREA
jgi:hypothetical protein